MADLSSQPTTIQSIYNWFSEDRIFVNRRYQRKLVWTLEEKQKLIESIQKKYPIPAILIAERESPGDSFEIIDGLQRIQAIVSFIEQSFSTVDGKLFDVTLFPTASNRLKDKRDERFPSEGAPTSKNEKISSKEVGSFLDYPFAVSVMRNASEGEIDDVFDRINTYGRRLSEQERRQSGVESDFSETVRRIACSIRGDTSEQILTLDKMPSISIDLPKTNHGYEVKADSVFWVKQGILRSTDLRDSMDEQCIADIVSCIIGGKLVERSKDALDSIYDSKSPEYRRIDKSLKVYGAERIEDEFKFCIDQINEIIRHYEGEKLRSLIFPKKGNTNPFPSVFATLFIAIHELVIGGKKDIGSFSKTIVGLKGLASRIVASRSATSAEERRKNINQIKGILSAAMVDRTEELRIYGTHSSIDIESLIQRSSLELPSFEFKQGLLTLDPEKRTTDKGIIEKVLKTIAAIANNGKNSQGAVVIGVADKKADAFKIKKLDEVEPIEVNDRYVVGVAREAAYLNVSNEDYFTYWRDGIAHSELSEPLKGHVLSSLDFNEFYGLGVLLIIVPTQKTTSYYKDDVYYREGDATKKATSAKSITDIAHRF